MNGTIPADQNGRIVKCRYCGTECADIDARNGHEPICPDNPASVAHNAVENARIAAARDALAAKSNK